jgi:hypothetical protein
MAPAIRLQERLRFSIRLIPIPIAGQKGISPYSAYWTCHFRL